MALASGPSTAVLDRDSATTASEAAFRRYLATANPQTLVLKTAFFYNPNLSDATLRDIVRHVRCPDIVLITAQHYRPEWAEGSPSLTRNQLRDMELTAGDIPWADRVEWFENLDGGDRLARLYGFLGVPSRSALESCRQFMVEDCVGEADLRFLNQLAACRPRRLQALVVDHSNHHVRRALAESPHLVPEFAEVLARDRAPTVRAAIAARAGMNEALYRALAADKSSKVLEALRVNEAIPLDMRRDLTDAKRAASLAIAEARDTDIGEPLALLRSEAVESDALHALTDHPSPVVRYAVADHALADESVFDRLLSSATPEEWTLAPIARRTLDPALIETFSRTADEHTRLELVQNPRIPLDTVVRIAGESRSISVRTLIADRYLDEPAVVRAVLGSRPPESCWESVLEEALDPSTRAARLRDLNDEEECRFRCVTRAIARHANCPKALVRSLAYRLPEDAIECAHVDDTEKARRRAFTSFGSYGFSGWIRHEYCVQSSALNGNLNTRRCVARAPLLNPTHLPRLLMLGDHDIEHEIAQRGLRGPGRSEPLPPFVRELLSFSPRGTVRKALAARKDLPDSIVRRLASDREVSVARVARATAADRGLSIGEPIVAPTAKSLGDRRSRLDLARTALDPDILHLLATDGSKDVRLALVKRLTPNGLVREKDTWGQLRNDLLVVLSCDKAPEIVRLAVPAVVIERLSPESTEIYQTVLRRIVDETEPDHDRFFMTVIERVDDLELLERRYRESWCRHRGVPGMNETIARRTRPQPE